MDDQRPPAQPRALLGLAAALLAGCAADGKPIPKLADEINATLQRPAFVLIPGDALRIGFDLKASDLDHETVVRPDGRASFRLLDDLPVAGLTIAQLDERLENAYAASGVALSSLTVFISELAPRTISVLGEVERSGSQELDGERFTLVDALARAGGPRFSARLDHTLLVRWMPERGENVAWKIDARARHWDSPRPILLQPNDVVYVPHKPVVDANTFVDLYIRRMLPFPFFLP